MGIYTAKELELIHTFPDKDMAKQVISFFKKKLKEQYQNTKELKLFPSYILAIDAILGGLPNHITQIYGWESTFKTTILLYIANKYKETSIFLNADNKPLFNKQCKDLPILQTDNKTNEYVKELITYGVADTILIDSLASLTRYDNVMKSIVNLMYQENLKLIFSNQTRANHYSENVPFGTDYIQSICHTTLAVTESKQTLYGYRVALKVIKPLVNLLIPIHIDKTFNINNSYYLIDLAINNAIIKKSGPYYKYLDKSYHLEDLVKATNILKEIWDKIFNGTNFRELYSRYLE